ncbi:MAG: hypothetical protein AB7P03_20470 [Kofleriaceae bacterium]
MKESPDDKPALVNPGANELIEEPPVVARLVIEIRSDGSRTIARGAAEDAISGQRTTIEARGDSPIQLAFALARTITQLPRLAQTMIRPELPDAPPSRSSSWRFVRAGARSAVRGLLKRRRDR